MNIVPEWSCNDCKWNFCNCKDHSIACEEETGICGCFEVYCEETDMRGEKNEIN